MSEPRVSERRKSRIAGVVLIALALFNTLAGFVAHTEYRTYELSTRAMEQPIVRPESEQERRAQLLARGWPTLAVDAYIRNLRSEEASRELQATVMRYAQGVLYSGRFVLFLNAGVCLALAVTLLRRRKVQ